MPSYWGVFRAYRMNGIKKRDKFYRRWYDTVSLALGEEPLLSPEGGHCYHRHETLSDLILTNQRLIHEPLSDGKKLASGDHGSKNLANTFSSYVESKRPAFASAVLLLEVTIDTRDEGKAAWLLVQGPDGTVEYGSS